MENGKEKANCKGNMELEDKWENTEGMSYQIEKINDEEAFTMSSVLVCKKGGLIMPLTSGQGDRIPLIPSQICEVVLLGKRKGFGMPDFWLRPHQYEYRKLHL